MKIFGLFFLVAMSQVLNAAVIDPSNPVVTYDVSKDSYYGKDSKNENHGDESILKVTRLHKRTAVIEAPVSLRVDFSNYFVEDPNDPNFEERFESGCNDLLRSAEFGELVLNVTTANCPENGCLLSVRPLLTDFNESGVTYHCPNDTNLANDDPDCSDTWNGGDNGPKTTTVEIENGFIGELRLDVTEDINAQIKKWRLEVKRNGSYLEFSSKEGSNGGYVDVKFPDPIIADSLAPYRQTVSVPAPNVQGEQGGSEYDGDVDINYALIGDANADVLFWFWHGVPNSSYMWRSVMTGLEERLANTNESVSFLAHDMFGFGLSERINSATCTVGFSDPPGDLHCDEPNYKPNRQIEILSEFANILGIGDDGQKVIVVTHDWGGLPGLSWASNNLSLIDGIATVESWMVACPDSEAFPNDTNADGLSCFDNSPLYEDPNLESFVRIAQRPYSDLENNFIALDALLLEQEHNGFDAWIEDPFGLNGFQSFQQRNTLGTVPQQIIDHYKSAFPPTVPPENSLRASFVQAPRALPYPIPLAPQAAQDYDFPNGVGGLSDLGEQGVGTIVKNYTDNFRANFLGPMLLMVAKSGSLYRLPGMVQAAEQNYQNQKAVCMGDEAHMVPEAIPFFVAQRLEEWAESEGIITVE